MGRHQTQAPKFMMPCIFIAAAGPKLFKFGNPWAYGKHRKTAMLRMPCTVLAVAGPKLFRKMFVNPWAYGGTPNKNRYVQDALYCYCSCGAETI